jgi:hypothetical protein
MVWACTYNEESNVRKLRCNVCDSKVATWQALEHHLVAKHLVPKDEIDGTYLALMVMKKSRGDLTEMDLHRSTCKLQPPTCAPRP